MTYNYLYVGFAYQYLIFINVSMQLFILVYFGLIIFLAYFIIHLSLMIDHLFYFYLVIF